MKSKTKKIMVVSILVLIIGLTVISAGCTDNNNDAPKYELEPVDVTNMKTYDSFEEWLASINADTDTSDKEENYKVSDDNTEKQN